MKDTTLKSLSEVVDKQANCNINSHTYIYKFIVVSEYNNFLKQPLTLEIFIPCKDGVPLIYDYKGAFDHIAEKNFTKEYQKALDRVLFKGFELIEISEGYYRVENNKIIVAIKNKGLKWSYNKYESIQDLVGEVQLTKKQHKLLNL